MSFFTTVKQLLTGVGIVSAQETQTALVGINSSSGYVTHSSAVNSVTLNRENRQMLTEFTRSIFIWRCVDLIAGAASGVPIWIKPPDGRESLTADETQVLAL